MVVAESEAVVAAKASGTLSSANYKVGDQVTLGQELAKIDDVNSAAFNPSNYNTNQIKQAKNVVDQADSAYTLAKTSYNNLLISSVKDLRSAEISRDQAAKGQSNLGVTTAESIKSAELAFDTSKIAVEQARLSLENRQKLADQSVKDTNTNAENTANTAVSTASAIITNINNVTAVDDNNTVSIPYRSNLGALDSTAYNTMKTSYQAAKDAYNSYSQKKFSSLSDKLSAASVVVQATKKLADDAKSLLDKTVPSSYLPQSAVTGVSLSGLQSAVAGYQTQMSGAVSQIDSANQALANISLNNSNLIDGLKQAYDLAQKQQASAEQALTNLKAGNTSQTDQAGFAYNLAQNQYDNLKVKIESQVQSAKTQMETAQSQYNNAVTSLQSLYDAHSVISPLNGTITKIYVQNGEAVAAGQPVLTVSQTQNIKVQFYVEPDNLNAITPGLMVKVETSNNSESDGIISAVSPQADAVTRRFLVEVKLEKTDGLLLGTVATVKLSLTKNATESGALILPIAAVTIGQNGSYIFIDDNNQAKKVDVQVENVIGELVQIKADLAPEAIIITEGNKLLSEGQAISLTQ
jgi:RND family efflux transporter MFP subunit